MDDVVDCGEAPRGERVQYEVVYQGSLDDTGYMRVSVNGVTCIERTGISNRAANPTSGYFKFSIHDPFHTTDPPLTLYLDDVEYYGY